MNDYEAARHSPRDNDSYDVCYTKQWQFYICQTFYSFDPTNSVNHYKLSIFVISP